MENIKKEILIAIDKGELILEEVVEWVGRDYLDGSRINI